MNTDFLAGYKTFSGLLVAILSLIVAGRMSQDDVVMVVANIGQVVGAILALYGLVMKIKTGRK